METLATIAVILLVGVTAFILGCILGSRLEASRNRREIAKKYKYHKVEHIANTIVPYDHKRKSFSDKIIEHLTTEGLIEFDKIGSDLSKLTFRFLTKRK